MKSSYFSFMHPAGCFSFFLCQLLILLASTNPLTAGLSFAFAIALNFHLLGFSTIKRIFSLWLPLIVLYAVFNSLFSHYGVTPLFILPSGNAFTFESLLFGAMTGLKAAAALVWLSCFNEIITPERFIYLFSPILPKTALVLSMALRFIPLLNRQAKEINDAHRAESLSLLNRIRQGVRNVSILITWVLERGIETAHSMTARGYGSGRRSRHSYFRFKAEDAMLIVLCALCIAAAAFARNDLKSTFNPVIRIPNLSCASVLFFAELSVLSCFPLAYDLTEKKRWVR